MSLVDNVILLRKRDPLQGQGASFAVHAVGLTVLSSSSPLPLVKGMLITAPSEKAGESQNITGALSQRSTWGGRGLQSLALLVLT